MRRIGMALIGGGATLAVAACGSAAAGSPSGSTSPSGRGGFRNASAGQLVQISGSRLILSGPNGDITVAFNNSTTVTQQRTGTVADITAGTCIVATGQKDSSGSITASSVLLSNPVNGACSMRFGAGGRGGGFAGAPRSPRPSFSPRATPNPNFGAVAGQVAANGVKGTAVTVQQTNGSSVTITVPTTVRVTMSSTVSASALATGQCVAATGMPDSSGTVQARSLTIVPAGPSGCFTGGGGFGGRGGFGFGGGAA